MTRMLQTTDQEELRRRLAELERQRAELLDTVRALQAGEIEPLAEIGSARPKPDNKRRLTKSTVVALPVPQEKNGDPLGQRLARIRPQDLGARHADVFLAGQDQSRPRHQSHSGAGEPDNN